MFKSISFKKLAVLTAGLAIVLSSCGLQNSASESSGDETAAGKTKNFALVNGRACFDSEAQLQGEVEAAVAQWNSNYYTWFPSGDVYPADAENLGGYVIGVNYSDDPSGFADAYWAPYRSPKIGGCEEPFAIDNGTVVEGTPTVATGAANVKTCLKPEVKQAMIDGYKEQIAKTDYPAEWSEATITGYQDEMERGLATTELTCTN